MVCLGTITFLILLIFIVFFQSNVADDDGLLDLKNLSLCHP